jgi:Family of unknown function (DUF5681)
MFKKGQSGNPGGKPKATVELAKLAREHTGEAWNVIIEILKDPEANRITRLHAAEMVLERGHGKAQQNINLRREENMQELTDAELNAIAAGAEDEAAASSGIAARTPGGSYKLN